MNKIRLLGIAGPLCAALAGPAAVSAQGWPAKPVRVVVPFGTGGGGTIQARLITDSLRQTMGATFVIDNRPGAGGLIGAQMVAESPPDGYTLLLGATTTHGINPVLQKLPYDAVKDFAPVSLVATIPHIIVINPQLPVNTIQEFIAYAKAKPGLTYGSAGTGSPHHLAGEMLKLLAGVDVVHVPYKGSGPAMSDLIGGQTQFMSIEYTAAAGNLKGGKLRALAVATPQRVPGIDLPTLVEAGLPGFEVTAWYAIYAPAGTAPDIVAALQGALAKGIRSGDAREKLASLNATAVGGTPEALSAHMRAEMERWARVIKAANVKPE